ncbi:KRI1-like family C-terminal-domain-containing protein [Lentinula aff. lateritia]|uniref:KRI1-like family C-terminal-domain-containing protein n=1 Tax=Lentinula aff. lateritia TaxID=2804960 RepID=A0ACC1U0R3_9AGAR|nr:KRI1-like family C-terminal-domain-containing protein [Lentinula aff. lateritia]
MSLLSDAESDSDFQLTINEHYAQAFQYKKEREELEQLKLKYGSEEEEDNSATDSEEHESEDEDGEELTPAVDAAILRTLARIKRKDPEIYNNKTDIFEEAPQEEQKKLGSTKPVSKRPKDKVPYSETPQARPITMRQVAMEAQLQGDSRSPSPEPLTHSEEQRRLRDETIAVFHQLGDDNSEGDDLFVPREKTKDEQEQEEEEYRSFLEREVGGDLKALVSVEENTWKEETLPSTESKQKKKKQKKGKDVKKAEDDDQEFLINYILNRGWIDRSTNRVPTYKEIVAPKKGKGKGTDEEGSLEDEKPFHLKEDIHPTADSEIDEEEFEDIVDRFESSYNFRFEEPDAAVIQTHPRQIPSLIRREDTTRKEARERRKKRREEEMEKKREEVKRMKALKMKELRMRLDRIGKQGGKNAEDDSALQELDLQGEWDPEAHDRQMAALYSDDAEYDEDGKPTWDDDINIGDIAMANDSESTRQKKKKKKKGEKAVEEDGVFVDAMDADIDKVDDDEWDGTEEMRKRKIEEYMDEVYGLDFNDMVGGIPTRFQYTHVEPENFHLSPTEILMATDAELNEYMGIKKFAPYRKAGKWDSNRGDRLKELRQKIGERGYGGDMTQDDKPVKKRKGKKERMRMKAVLELDVEEDVEKEKKKRRRHKKKNHSEDLL